MITVDQIGQEHTLVDVPTKIVSLVPSITELLCDMGLRRTIVGCTKFCVHPQGLMEESTTVGGTKNVDIDKCVQLDPDIILANKEENTKADIDALREICPVWVADIKTIDDVRRTIVALADIFDRVDVGQNVVQKLVGSLPSRPRKLGSVVYLIWRRPYMTVGGDTYISHMLGRCGFTNVFDDSERYPEIQLQDISDRSPDHVFLSSEPYPFTEKHVADLHDLLGHASIHVVDGEFFSWYGTRTIHCEGYLDTLANQLATS